MRQGKYMASLKAFSRATELDEKLIYSHYQQAHINNILGLTKESLVHFEKTLRSAPDYIPALQELGSSKLNLAKQEIR